MDLSGARARNAQRGRERAAAPKPLTEAERIAQALADQQQRNVRIDPILLPLLRVVKERGVDAFYDLRVAKYREYCPGKMVTRRRVLSVSAVATDLGNGCYLHVELNKFAVHISCPIGDADARSTVVLWPLRDVWMLRHTYYSSCDERSRSAAFDVLTNDPLTPFVGCVESSANIARYEDEIAECVVAYIDYFGISL